MNLLEWLLQGTIPVGIVGSYGPTTEAWILTGSILATYGVARGWGQFWLVWILVDVVGVTTLVQAGFYPTAVMYFVYGLFCLWGFAAWVQARRRLVAGGDAVAQVGAAA